MRYVTTNLRFSPETYRELRYQAARRGVTLASVVRDAAERYLGRAGEGAALPFGEDPADSLIGFIETSGGDESVNHDHYLYGWPKETESEAPGGHERAAGAGLSRRSETTQRPPRSSGKTPGHGSS
jgi:hypothetical protein